MKVTVTPATPEKGGGVLSPEQGEARSAFTNFCWNLQSARAKKPIDTSLLPDLAKTILSLLERSNEDVRAEGEHLWETWEATNGHDVVPAIFTRENMRAFLTMLETTRLQHIAYTKFLQSIEGKQPTPIQPTDPNAKPLSNS